MPENESHSQIEPNVSLSAHQLLARLKLKYPAPEYALIPNVANALGWGPKRRADAIAMSLWASHGFDLHGFELKSSRSDWLREKKDPEKAETVARYCNRWWLVAGHGAIVKDGELPGNWGLIVPHGAALRVAVGAKPLEPAQLDRGFLAAILRAAHNNMDRTEIEAEVDLRVQQAIKNLGAQRDNQRAHVERELATLRTAVDDFEKASGVRINAWHAGDIGAAVRLVLHGDREVRRLEQARQHLLDLADSMGGAIAVLSAIAQQTPEEPSPTPGDA